MRRPRSRRTRVLAIPAAVSIVVALHRLVTGGDFDRASIVLGVLTGVVVVLREALAARDVARYARHVARQEARFRTLVAGSADVIMVLDGDLMVRWQSTAAARQFGLSDQEVVGRHFQSMVHPDDAVLVAQRLADVRAGFGGGADGDAPVLVEARLRDGFGRWRETESAITDQRGAPEVSGLVVHIRDVAERKEMERTLHRLAYADPLTGLANRRQMLMSIVAQRSAPRAHGALLVIELDGFNAVNDVRGFDIGDAVLVEAARRLRAGAGAGDLPARLSGDEFAVVTEGTAVQSYALATRLLTMLAEPVQLPGVTVHLSASIGMTDLAGAANGDDVLRRADLALRRAKQHGRGRVEWYDPAVEEAIVRRMTLEQELPEALAKGRTRPDLPADTRSRARPTHGGRGAAAVAAPTAGHTAARRRDPGRRGPRVDHGDRWLGLAPGVPAAGDLAARGSGSVDGGQCIAVPTCRPGALHRGGRSARPSMRSRPIGWCWRSPKPGSVTARPGSQDRVGALRSLGVRTALDEFGTGVASLTHLRTLPIDMVKIGRSFFDDATAGPPRGQSVPLIDVMVGLGRRLGIEVVAQGLEAPAHLDVVRGAGCRLGQGHLFARPQPAERTEAYLDGFPVRQG